MYVIDYTPYTPIKIADDFFFEFPVIVRVEV